MSKPLCAVRGLVAPGAMCGRVIVGGKLCGYSGECEHQRKTEDTTPEAQPVVLRRTIADRAAQAAAKGEHGNG